MLFLQIHFTSLTTYTRLIHNMTSLCVIAMNLEESCVQYYSCSLSLEETWDEIGAFSFSLSHFNDRYSFSYFFSNECWKSFPAWVLMHNWKPPFFTKLDTLGTLCALCTQLSSSTRATFSRNEFDNPKYQTNS